MNALTCAQAARVFRDWSRSSWAASQAAEFKGMANALKFLGDTPAPAELLEEYPTLATDFAKFEEA